MSDETYPPNVIYLIPFDGVDWSWCDEPAPEPGMEKSDAVKYVKASPTHYAVVDEYGEIIFAARMNVILDAERKCQDFIRQCRKDPVTRNDALNWTIKGVTVSGD